MNETVSHLLSLEQAVRGKESLDELAFFVTHQTRIVYPYQKAIAWSGVGGRGITIESISNLSELDQHSPYVHSVVTVIKELVQKREALPAKKIGFFQKKDFSASLQSCWPEGLSVNLVIYPFYHEGIVIGGLIFGVNVAPTEEQVKQLEWLFEAYNYAWRLLNKKGHWFAHFFSKLELNRRSLTITGIVLVLVLIIRIPQTVMAPVTVIPKDPTIVTAPMDGAIESTYVKPDQNVEQGQLLFSMEKRDVNSQHELALRELDTAKAKWSSAIQTGFKNIDNRAEINSLEMEVKEKQLRVDYTAYLLQEADIRASSDGVAIIDDPDYWVGRPVGIGEKIMKLAQRNHLQFEIFLPVSDSIEFKAGDRLNVYLTDDPLRALHGKISYFGFEAVMTPKQVLAYRIIASFDEGQAAPRLGSQGTAKIIGQRVSVFYYLLRRPIGFLRQTLGW